MVTLSIFEDGIPPVFRIQFDDKWEGAKPTLANISVTTKRTENNQVSSQVFKFTDQVSKEFYQSTEDIPEPHEFDAVLTFQTASGSSHSFPIEFREAEDHHASDNEHGVEMIPVQNGAYAPVKSNAAAKPAKNIHIDNNFRGALIHVVADAFVSCLVLIALVIEYEIPYIHVLDPIVAIIGALVIISWGITLVCDTIINLLDMSPDNTMKEHMKKKIESDGSKVTDLHLWCLGPGHLGVILSVVPPMNSNMNRAYYKDKLRSYKALSHITIEVLTNMTV